MKRFRPALVILLVTLALDLALAQVAKRVLPTWPATMPASNPRQPSPIFHHGLRPMMAVHSRAGPIIYPFNTNSLGMVDAEPRRVDVKGGGCRVLVIGDSFTEGFGVGWDKSFAGILARRWSGQGIELLNAGVVTYSPSIYYRKIRHLVEEVGLRFDAVLAFIDMSDASDEWHSYDLNAAGNVVAIGGVAQIPPMREPKWLDHLWYRAQDNSLLLHLAKDLYGALTRKAPTRPPPRPSLPHLPPLPLPLGRIGVPAPIDVPPPQVAEFDGMINIGNGRWTVDPHLWNEYGRDGALVGAERMDRLLLLLRARSIPLAIAVYPWPDQLFAGDRDSAQRRFWGEWARTRGAGFIDLFPAFFAAPDARAAIHRYYIAGDFHWNAAGHALVADTVGRAYEPRRFCK
ncbi:MAG: SGNH/GDSL hydrolase family protein [Alphaproteobacteria bacterium]|nr:SGNH/GDSL hydrolase family protein [Alphaproteobacteria bacterium]